MARDAGQFSLAGAQPKTALVFDGQRWGVPYGPTPTTHILKPPSDVFDGTLKTSIFVSHWLAHLICRQQDPRF